MNRRDALALTSLLVGGTILGSEVWLLGCTSKPKSALFTEDDVLFLDEVGETILPKTERSPGAKEVHIGEFMKIIVTECYDEDEQKIFMEGIQKINELSEQKFDSDFLALSSGYKFELISKLDREASQFKNKTNSPPHYFTLIKQLTIWGYFSSESGTTQALRYNPVPGRYEGCVPYTTNEKAWA